MCIRTARAISTSASRSQVDALSSPVLVSIREAASSWACMMNRRASSTVGTAAMASTGVTATTTVISRLRSNSAKSACSASRFSASSASPHRGVAQLDRRHDQELVAEAADQLAYCDGQDPGDGVRPRADRAAGEGIRKLAEQQGRRPVGQADGAGSEDPAVDHALVHPPLGEHLQRDRGEHGVDRRQQDRHREHPGGEEVPGHASLEVRDPRGGRDRDHAADQQQQELQQVRSGPGRLRRREHDHDERGERNGPDVSAEQRGKLPPGPVPDNGVPERTPSDGRGFHGPPFRMGLDRLLSSRQLTVKD